MKYVYIALVALLAGAGVHFSLEQKEKYEELIAHKWDLYDGPDGYVKWFSDYEKKMVERGDMEKSRDEWLAKREEWQVKLGQAKEKNKDLKDTLADLDARIDVKRKEFNVFKEQLAVYKVEDPQEIRDMVDREEKRATELAAALEDMAAQVKAWSQKVAATTSDRDAKLDEQAKYRAKLARNGKEYMVTAVDPEWGFVVINAGEKAQLDPSALLLVTRGGKTVAKLRLTSIEKNQSVADVVRNSLSPGMRVQPGDSVQLLTPVTD